MVQLLSRDALSQGIAFAALLAFALAAPAAARSNQAPDKAADPWVGLVGESRDTVVKAIGSPELEFVGLVDEGAIPLQMTPMGAPQAFDEDGPLPVRSAVRVLQYSGGERGMDFQVVLKDDRVLWAVTPPGSDEKSAAAVTKKYGAVADVSGDVFHADILRTWDVMAYPQKGRAFVRTPGSDAVIARVIQAPKLK